MSSTYSTNLALELVGTGEQAGNWGATNNLNLGTLIEQAISGIVTQAMADSDQTITIPQGASGVARNMSIECTGALTAARSLIVPTNKKLYFIYNNTTGGKAVTVKVSGQTGVSVPMGAKVILSMNSAGTDIVDATNYISSLTLGSPLPVTSGGTGASSSAPANLGVIPAADLPTVGDFLVGVNTSLSVTGASGTGTTATLTYAAQTVAPFLVGQTITISGVSPSGYNATANVTACNTTSVSYLNTTSTTYVSGGTVSATVGNIPAAATVAASATTSNIWSARYNVLSGSAVAFTTVANAPYIGAISYVIANAAHVLTSTANLTVQGGTYLATTGASGTGSVGTITFATQSVAPFIVGQSITVAGVTPTGYNGTYTVTACTTSSVSFATSTTGSQTVAGTVGSNYTCASGDLLIFTAITTSTFRVFIQNAAGVPVTAPGTAGSVLTSNGTTWVSTPASALTGIFGQVFTSSGTYTVPLGVTAVKVTVVGGGGDGGSSTSSASSQSNGGGGGAGGVGIKYVTGLTAGNTVSVTVGSANNTSSFGSFISAAGGSAGTAGVAPITQGTPGANGSTTGADYSIPALLARSDWEGRSNSFGTGAAAVSGANGNPGTGYGSGGSGGQSSSASTFQSGGAGASGIVIVEW